MSHEAVIDQTGAVSEYWNSRRNHLFVASCMALIVTAMSFAIRGAILADLGNHFGLNNTKLGWINGNGFIGFTVAMIVGGPLCDVLGMRRLLGLAFAGHLLGIVFTIYATSYTMLLYATLAIGIGNGFVEAACNPLLAGLYPDQKIKRLNLFHVWFPGGIVIGGLVSFVVMNYLFKGSSHAWQIDIATMLIPLIIYGVMFLGREFPATERAASKVTTEQMFRSCLNPFFLFFVGCMLLTASTELSPEGWIPDILSRTTNVAGAGILFLVLINGLMAIGRTQAGSIVNRMSPMALLFLASIFSAVGLFGFSVARSPGVATVAAIVFAIGVCYYWPTMLGNVNERFPETGALGLAIMGGAGNASVWLTSPWIGHTYDTKTAQAAHMSPAQYGALMSQVNGAGQLPAHAVQAGGAAAMLQAAILPCILILLFGAVYLYDKSRGGWHAQRRTLQQIDEAVVEQITAPVQAE